MLQLGAAGASVPGNSLAAIDPGTNRVVAEFPVGDTPTSVSVGAGAAWTLSADEQTVSRVDPQTETVKTFATGALPIDLAAGAMRSGSCKARTPEHTARATTR
jgi:YVTN family beta-propeller protein